MEAKETGGGDGDRWRSESKGQGKKLTSRRLRGAEKRKIG